MIKALLVKEFILVARDKHALAALFILPAIFILIMSLALKDTFGTERAIIRYTVVDEDKTLLSNKAISFLAENTETKGSNETFLTAFQRQQALNNTLHFILTIPKGFADSIANEHFDAPLLLLDAATDVKQEMLTLFKSELAMVTMRLGIEKIKDEFGSFLPDMAQKFAGLPSDSSNLVQVRFNAMAVDEKPTSTQQSVPSWIVFGMFFVVIPMSTVFINELKQNTLMRISTMNISIPVLFAGKIAPYMVINQIQVWLMIFVGIFVVPLFGGQALTLGDSIIGLCMVSFGLSFAAIGTSMLIAVIASTVEQATTIGGIVNVLMGAIGGIMVPKFVMPPTMQKLANFSPMSWGLDGFLDIFLRGLGADAVLIESLALAGFGVGLLLVAAMLFRAKMKLHY